MLRAAFYLSLCSTPLCWVLLCWMSLCWVSRRRVKKPTNCYHYSLFRGEQQKTGKSHWRGRLSTVDLLVLISVDKLLFNWKYYLLVFKTSSPNEEVNCTVPAPLVRALCKNTLVYFPHCKWQSKKFYSVVMKKFFTKKSEKMQVRLIREEF